MSQPSGADPGQHLISDAEREAAISALRAHRASGRLSSSEYEDRQVLAGSARRWSELSSLFTDLPQPHPVPGGVVAVPNQPLPNQPLPNEPLPNQPLPNQPLPNQALPDRTLAAAQPEQGVIPVSPEVARLVLGLTPFAALVLFFVAPGGWLWFLAIPVMGMLLGPQAGRHRGRDRRRNR